MLLSLPDTWNYSVRGLSSITPDGVDGVLTALKELERLGYLERNQQRESNGRMGRAEYVIYEMPRKKPCSESPCTEKPYTVNPDTDTPVTENPAQLSTNRTSTETLQRKVSVEAASQEDAERMVTQAWNNQDYVLDSSDFTGVDFKTVGERELAETRTMDVLLVQPNAYPKKISVGTELEDLQAMVGGDIEVTYPFEDEVAIILNESGKINGLPLNRAIYTEDGDMQDIYAGDFLVVGLTEDDFGSLTSEQMQKFEEQFHQPQMFVRMGRSIMAIPVPDDMVKKMEEKAAKPQEKSKPAPDRDSL